MINFDSSAILKYRVYNIYQCFKLSFYDLKINSKNRSRLVHGQEFRAKFQLNNLFRVSIIIIFAVLDSVEQNCFSHGDKRLKM